MDSAYDVAVIGGGIVGLAAARALLQRRPAARLLLLEKESRLATHQTGHNSGVIHSGIYYRPGSLKARLCVAGARQLTAFCDAQRIPYQRCGKVIVAVEERELPRLQQLEERGRANGVPGLERIGLERLREIEPHARGVAALHLPQVAIVDYVAVANALAREITQAGGTVLTSARLTGALDTGGEWRLETTQGTQRARLLVNCGGLQSDRVGRLAQDHAPVRIVPFRGEYYHLRPERASLVRGLVYPVPDPAMPFLGVHFTKMLDGGVHVGPNAVLALKREGYLRSDISWRDSLELLMSPAFWKMTSRHWKAGMEEMRRSISKRAFLQAAQRLVPDVAEADLLPSPAGVRAQAVASDGSLVDDFVLHQTEQALHVYNAPSPAATASLAIGEAIADRVASP